MKKKAVIFGTGTFGELACFYLENDSKYQVEAFTGTTPQQDHFLGKPLIDFSDIENTFPTHTYDMFVAIGYRKMNALRKDFCHQARAKGYSLLSYISSKATWWDKQNKIGDNVFIFENNNLQPFVEIGDGAILWSGNHIGHHTKIGAYSFLTSHVVVSGFCNIGEQSFLGVNVTIMDNVSLGSKVLVGAGALVSKSLEAGTVILGQKGTVLNKKSEYFLR